MYFYTFLLNNSVGVEKKMAIDFEKCIDFIPK